MAQKGNQLLTDCLVGSIDVTMAEEDAYAKLVDVAADNYVGVAEKVDSSLVIVTADSLTTARLEYFVTAKTLL